MGNRRIDDTALLFNSDGSIYHLSCHPEQVAKDIILVGDPDRVATVSSRFDHIEYQVQKREFVTHTGYLGERRVSVVSTGIGTGNIDIVLNELDALHNINLETRAVHSQLTTLNLLRLGTCGCLDAEVPPSTLVLSQYAIAFDGLMNFYNPTLSKEVAGLIRAAREHFASLKGASNLYAGAVTEPFYDVFKEHCHIGITLTNSGFYGPQQRHLRVPLADVSFFELAQGFRYEGQSVMNLEMETAAIYALGNALGHQVCSLSSVVANRATQAIAKSPRDDVESLIDTAFDLLF